MFYFKLFLVIFFINIIKIYAINNGANEPIPWTDLGLTARDCSSTFCENKDGLGLWMAIYSKCLKDDLISYSHSYSSLYKKKETEEHEINNYSNLYFSPFIVGSLLSLSSVLFCFVGYNYAYKSNKYIQLKKFDNSYDDYESNYNIENKNINLNVIKDIV
jgi:hypothetical protein